MSPEYLHFFSTGGQPSSGATLSANQLALKDHGQPIEANCPYVQAGPPKNWKPDDGFAVFRREMERLPRQPADIENQLKLGYPPILAIAIPDTFFKPSPPWVISPVGKIRGYHAVVAVGLGSFSGTKTFLIRNSWGTGWGDNGYAWVDEAFLSQHLVGTFVIGREVSN